MQIVPVAVSGKVAPLPIPQLEKPRRSSISPNVENQARNLVKALYNNPATQQKIVQRLSNKLHAYERKRKDLDFGYILKMIAIQALYVLVICTAFFALPLCAHGESDCWGSSERLWYWGCFVVLGLPATHMVIAMYQEAVVTPIFKTKISTSVRFMFWIGTCVLSIVLFEIIIAAVGRPDLPLLVLIIITLLEIAGFSLLIFGVGALLFREAEAKEMEVDRWEFYKSSLYMLTCLSVGGLTLTLYAAYSMGFFLLRDGPKVYFVIYTTFFLYFIRWLNLKVLVWFWYSLGSPDLIVIGQSWVYITHACYRSFLRATCSDSFVDILIVTVCDLMSICEGSLCIVSGGWKKVPNFFKLCGLADDVAVDRSKNFWTKIMFEKVSALVLEEFVEVVVALLYLIVFMVLYMLPSGEHVLGVRADAPECNIYGIPDMTQFVKAQILIVITEFITIFALDWVVSALGGVDVYVILDSMLRGRERDFINYATCVVLVFTLMIFYLPLGFDCTFQFGWL